MTPLSTDQTIEKYLASVIGDGQLDPAAGLSIAVFNGESILYKNCFGLRDSGSKDSVDEDSLFGAGSFAKPLVSALLMKLAQDGTIGLNDKINGKYEQLILSDSEITGEITFADILCHRVGLRSHDLLWLLSGFDRKELMSRLQFLPLPAGGFRNSFFYSNLLYTSLAGILENMLNEDFHSLAQRIILKPFELPRTTFSYQAAKHDKALVQPYAQGQQTSPRNTDPIVSAGGLYTSLEDAIRWLQLLLKKEGLESVFFKEMWHAHNGLRAPNPFLLQGLEWLGLTPNYGFGWFLGEFDGHKVVFHPGFIDGYSCIELLMPEFDFGLVVLSNLNMSPVPGQLANAIVANFLGKEVERPVQTAPPMGAQSTNALELPSSLIGDYVNEAYGPLEILQEQGQAYGNYFGHRWPIAVQSEDELVFSLTAMDITLPFPSQVVRTGDRVHSLEIPLAMDPTVPPVVFKKL
jgi:CubicO group peptidase (beta-lactamase class C family)